MGRRGGSEAERQRQERSFLRRKSGLMKKAAALCLNETEPAIALIIQREHQYYLYRSKTTSPGGTSWPRSFADICQSLEVAQNVGPSGEEMTDLTGRRRRKQRRRRTRPPPSIVPSLSPSPSVLDLCAPSSSTVLHHGNDNDSDTPSVTCDLSPQIAGAPPGGAGGFSPPARPLNPTSPVAQFCVSPLAPPPIEVLEIFLTMDNDDWTTGPWPVPNSPTKPYWPPQEVSTYNPQWANSVLDSCLSSYDLGSSWCWTNPEPAPINHQGQSQPVF